VDPAERLEGLAVVARVRRAGSVGRSGRVMSTPLDYDVAIVGAGDVGAAIARELSRFELHLALIDAGRDVGGGTSKANTAILHTGFDAKPETKEARLVARGHGLLRSYATEVGIPLERVGALLVAWNDEQLARFPMIQDNACACGYDRVRQIPVDELYRREPHLGAGALGALEVPDESIVCPWTPPLAYATQAVVAGTDLRLRERVVGLKRIAGRGWSITTSRAWLTARWMVNAAGLFSDEVHRMAGMGGFTVTPRRGELIVFDKLARPLVRHIVLPVPNPKTKGVVIAPTVFGNVLLGPTAEDIRDKRDTAATAEGIAFLLDKGRRLMPRLLDHEVTSIYAGLRAATEHSDYQLEVLEELRYVCAGGIRSTGLSGSMAIAEYVRDRLEAASVPLRERPGGLPSVQMPNIGEAFPRPYAQPDRIAGDPEYGAIVCFCERVTRGEIRDAARSPIPPADLDGLRRRTRVLTGRCQGFFCGAHVAREYARFSGKQAGTPWDSAP
jgi:glycerol-3-phosphate dehydrogenase